MFLFHIRVLASEDIQQIVAYYEEKSLYATDRFLENLYIELDVIKENKWLKDSELSDIDAWVKKEVEESVEFAENSPYPEGKELYEDVYKEENYPYIVEY